MPFARNSLDLIVCSSHPDVHLGDDGLAELHHKWLLRGWIDQEGYAQLGQGLIEGGFYRLLLEPADKIRLYANHQGGYRVNCPHCSSNVASSFAAAVQRWRAGGERGFECPRCHHLVPLEQALLRPQGAFSQGALWFRGVESVQLTLQAHGDIQQWFGETKIVLRRLS